MGSGWSQLLILLSRRRLDDMDSVFSRPPWDRGGRGAGEWEVVIQLRWQWLMPAFGGLLRDRIGSTLYWEIKSRWQEFILAIITIIDFGIANWNCELELELRNKTGTANYRHYCHC